MNIKFLRKWYNMLFHRGTLHTRKGISALWERDSLKGFYIDYSSKLKNKNIDTDGLPYNILSDGTRVKMPITIIQFGLGACEEYYKSASDRYRVIVKDVAEYLVNSQMPDGGWDAFVQIDKDDKRSSMVQAEAAAFLLRASLIIEEDKYYESASKAIEQMLHPIKDGGATDYSNNEIKFYEFVGKPLVLNGWIYSIFGLYDYWVFSRNNEIWDIIQKTKKSLIEYLPRFDCGYWSMYNLGKQIASPFYHELHITQLEILFILFGEDAFANYNTKWKRYYNNKVYYFFAFLRKAFQKLKSTSHNDMIE